MFLPDGDSKMILDPAVPSVYPEPDSTGFGHGEERVKNLGEDSPEDRRESSQDNCAAGEITRLLRAARDGGEAAATSVMPLVYDDLKKIARNQLSRWRPGQTLNTTALVHEGYAKLAGAAALEWEDRRHYFAIAAQAMRQIVVDYARSMFAAKRQHLRSDLDLARLPDDGRARAEQITLVDQLLERLEKLDPEMVRIVECRFFAAYTLDETAEALGISRRTVQRKWERARSWLVELGRESG